MVRKRKIRILQVIDRIGNAGAETLQRTFAESLDRSLFELHVCGLRPRPGSITLPALQAMGVCTLVLNQRTSYDLPALYALVRYIRRHKIDLVHTHLLAGDVMGRLAGLLTGRPVVSTIHSGTADLDEEPRRRQWLERWTARVWCRRLVVVSDLLRDEIASWFGLPRSKVLSIPNAVDTRRFHPVPQAERLAIRQSLLGGDYPLAVNVARLVPQKGQRTLLEAARLVLDARPDVRFALVGDGPEREELEARTAELGLSSAVTFMGLRGDIPRLLAASDIFVLSSLWEGMPVSLLEAMSTACACVCTEVGGVPQLVQHAVTGFLVPPANSPRLAEALLLCFNDTARSRAVGAEARSAVVEKYGMQAWARKWESLYLRELGLQDSALRSSLDSLHREQR